MIEQCITDDVIEDQSIFDRQFSVEHDYQNYWFEQMEASGAMR